MRIILDFLKGVGITCILAALPVTLIVYVCCAAAGQAEDMEERRYENGKNRKN